MIEANDKKTILMIEDNETYGKLVKMNLEAAGYRVIIAESGLKGLNTAREARPDLILLDVMLPELNGHQVSRLLKKDSRFADIPILMLTSRDLDADRNHAKLSQVQGYVIKTEPMRSIVARVASSINN